MPAKSSAVEWPAVAPVETKEIILAKWEAAEKALARAKEAELALRNQVVEAFYPSHKDEGTENVLLGNGYKLKAVFKMNRRLAGVDDVNTALEKIEALGPEGRFIAERIVRWKPELSKTEYDKADLKYQKIINTVLTISPATPALEIVEPKAKK